MLTAIDVASGASTALARAPIVLRSFRLSPAGRQLSYVAPVPETLGVIGKEQNDTFVLPIDLARGAAPAAAVKLAERGRLSWSPDGAQLLFVKNGRLMVLPADGRGEARPWRDGFALAVSEPVWAPDGSRFAALVADPSVTDPELEPVKPGMYTTAQPFMDLYVVKPDGSSANITSAFDDQVTDPVWSPDGGALFFRAVNNKTYDETVYRYSVAEQKIDTVVRGQESYSRFVAAPGGLVSAVEAATRPLDLWMFGADGQRTRITELNPQLARFTFSKPELLSFHNADGDRLGALLYKPAGLGANDKVPVITWVYEKMTPAIHRFNARDQMFISHGYAMLMPNVRIKVGRTADSYESCVIPAVNAGERDGLHEREVRDLGPQLRRVRDVKPDHADQYLRGRRLGRDAAGAVSQLGELAATATLATSRPARRGWVGAPSSIRNATSHSRRSFISTRCTRRC
jgi:dipeptidyl aminopeptidase/acylaminoacyl peptidase